MPKMNYCFFGIFSVSPPADDVTTAYSFSLLRFAPIYTFLAGLVITQKNKLNIESFCYCIIFSDILKFNFLMAEKIDGMM